MQYEAKNPQEYLEQLEDDWRKEKLMTIRQYILDHAPDLEEGIEYKMLSYSKDSSSFFHLNAQKGYVSLYVGSIDKIVDAEELLEGFNRGKGCIRVKKSVILKETGLETFVKRAIEAKLAGKDISC
ncbi:iron chaperone [Falsibacillus albus]|uniref:DUF1801 domain-containing protein n=1 Tax=Falsibacillus albus TaxID=2478915 RepID=A0A3L7JRS5_9BACI|nr:DUF1801 domain-containing protein [Falsibacillus albus]RLQ92411.1 DUF1801 domain-containing protein [Falsibacillus albus]